MTLFFVFRLAFSAYPCCWKEIWEKFKKIRTIWGIFGKILVRDDPGKIQASGKKNQKKSEKIRRFPNFSGRYLVKAKGAAGKRRKEKTEKSLKKSDHFRIFVEDTCLERSWQITGFRKEKLKKVRKKGTTDGFFGKHYAFFYATPAKSPQGKARKQKWWG